MIVNQTWLNIYIWLTWIVSIAQNYNNRSNLNSHMKSTHNTNLFCVKCSMSFEERYSLKRECSNCFGLKGNLKRHIKTIHNRLKDFQCDKCLNSFVDKRNLRMHMKTIHLQTKDVWCAMQKRHSLDLFMDTNDQKRLKRKPIYSILP